MIHVLYNPLSNNKKGEEAKAELEKKLNQTEILLRDIREISDTKSFVNGLAQEDQIILVGGDGTLSRFVNEIYSLKTTLKISLYSAGSGNDFASDVKEAADKISGLIPLNKYIESLPLVKVNGMEKRFLNGIGYGIDGYCCEEGDRLREQSDKPVNYAGIAIKGLLGKFKPFSITITVDGVSHSYKNVWLCPTMIGRYYGGGMIIAPEQDRLNSQKTVTSVVWHNWNKFGTLMAFPSVFKGEHVKYKKMIDFYTGHQIKVTADRPIALQIDGETVRNVREYTVEYR
ncbi:MAG: hypothetical protein K6E78_02845 [Treponema sp.]|nr:hypothetical protein [Treponema sp.]